VSIPPLTNHEYDQIFIGLLNDLHQMRSEINRLEHIVQELKKQNDESE